MTPVRPMVHPNLFELQGYDTQITYASTSITGAPQLTYLTGGQPLRFSGDEIVVEQTQLGHMVSVVLPETRAFESLTLLIPVVHLPQDARESEMQTTAIFSQPVKVKEGQSQTYMTLFLSGTAQQVSF